MTRETVSLQPSSLPCSDVSYVGAPGRTHGTVLCARSPCLLPMPPPHASSPLVLSLSGPGETRCGRGDGGGVTEAAEDWAAAHPQPGLSRRRRHAGASGPSWRHWEPVPCSPGGVPPDLTARWPASLTGVAPGDTCGSAAHRVFLRRLFRATSLRGMAPDVPAGWGLVPSQLIMALEPLETSRV